MLNKNHKIFITITLFTLPIFALAEQLGKTKTLLDGLKSIVSDILIPLVFTLALLFFFWGVSKYIWSEGSAKEDGRKIMVWGVIALFVMSSIWGIISLLRGELGVGSENTMKIPTIGGSGGSGSGFPCPDNPNEICN